MFEKQARFIDRHISTIRLLLVAVAVLLATVNGVLAWMKVEGLSPEGVGAAGEWFSGAVTIIAVAVALNGNRQARALVLEERDAADRRRNDEIAREQEAVYRDFVPKVDEALMSIEEWIEFLRKSSAKLRAADPDRLTIERADLLWHDQFEPRIGLLLVLSAKLPSQFQSDLLLARSRARAAADRLNKWRELFPQNPGDAKLIPLLNDAGMAQGELIAVLSQLRARAREYLATGTYQDA
jgi:hypothetical protein